MVGGARRRQPVLHALVESFQHDVPELHALSRVGRRAEAKTARPQVAWQVPVGNQYFLTMNNTCGHYQDNVAPYFMSHASDLFSAGLIAVLFGAGNQCQTTYLDGAKDGVTNNGGATTTDALGGCAACNTHTSTVADDDGGFLRQFVGQYYAAANCLGTVTARSFLN